MFEKQRTAENSRFILEHEGSSYGCSFCSGLGSKKEKKLIFLLKKVRIDKWLWSVRIFKSRTIATDACKSGKVRIAHKAVKPSFLVECGEVVQVRKNNFDLQFKVLELIQKRVGAPLAQRCYKDLTPEEELAKFKDWYKGKAGTEIREKGSGRPTKRERRTMEKFKDERY